MSKEVKNYTNKEIEAYNNKREKLMEAQKEKELAYKMTEKELDKAIDSMNKMLKEDKIDMVITKDNIDECYKKLNDKKNKDMEKGLKIMEEIQADLDELE